MAFVLSQKTVRVFATGLFIFAAAGAAFAIWYLNRDDNQVAPDDSAAGICCDAGVCNDGWSYGSDPNYGGSSCAQRNQEACEDHGGHQSGGGSCGGSDDGGGDGSPETCNPNEPPWTTTGQSVGAACCGGGVLECASGQCSGTVGIVGECVGEDGQCSGGQVYCGGCVESCVDLTGYSGCQEYIDANCGGGGDDGGSGNPYCPSPDSPECSDLPEDPDGNCECNSGVNTYYGNNCNGTSVCTNPAGSSCTGEIHACDNGGGACINQVDSFGPGESVNCIDIANSLCQYVQLDVVCDGSGNSALTCYPTTCTPGGDDGSGDDSGDDGGDDGSGDDSGDDGGTDQSCAISHGIQCIEGSQVRINWTASTTGFDITSTSGRIVVRINDLSDPWFTTGSDIWWATNYQEFINSGQNPENASWVFDIDPNVQYDVRVSIDPNIATATVEGLCTTAIVPFTCTSEITPLECGDVCTSDVECGGNLVCDDNLCKIPECEGESCVCTPPSPENPDWAIDKTGGYICTENSTYADVDYEITVQNIGAGSGTLTEVVDTLDPNVDSDWVVQSSISDDGELQGNSITWELSGADATFDPGESMVLTYTVRIPSTHFGDSFENNVEATPSSGDSFTADETVTVICDEPLPDDTPLPGTGLFDSTLGKIGLGVFITSISLLFVVADDVADKVLLGFVDEGERTRQRNNRMYKRVKKLKEKFEKGFK